MSKLNRKQKRRATKALTTVTSIGAAVVMEIGPLIGVVEDFADGDPSNDDEAGLALHAIASRIAVRAVGAVDPSKVEAVEKLTASVQGLIEASLMLAGIETDAEAASVDNVGMPPWLSGLM